MTTISLFIENCVDIPQNVLNGTIYIFVGLNPSNVILLQYHYSCAITDYF